ncbi:hypothetical protein [Yersinia phage fHe-Yen9-03]|uniref:Uncharacterized protein n=1 Tax=Yersinia phage fHe-Yen9-03 TaxID=2052743 RepID=A0A2C9CYW1_9CAUD|nr:hypothetical protein [Yersinia phage fHe-Yen9-03]
MPSKSKAQARFMAAAAHDPEFANKAGISTNAAKEWNHADEKAGNLKKTSKKPEHVNEEVINEASGVGIIKVPPALLNKIQRYVGSILLTMGYTKQQELQKHGETEQSKALINYLKRFQRKYNAAILSPNDLRKYINSVSTVPLDADEIFSQLPENIKKRPGAKELIQNLKLRLRISNQLVGRGGSNQTNGNLNIQEIGIPSYSQKIKPASIDNVVQSLNYAIGTIEHELQHAIQTTVLQKLNSNDKQTERKARYTDGDDAYYASGIEFGPQVKDLASAATDWLENRPDEITGNKNTDISNAIKYAMSTYSQGKIINALRNYKHNDRANKAMKLIYREVSNFYDNEYADLSDSGELDTSEQNVFGDTTDTSVSLEHPEPGQSTMGDLWLAISQYFGEKPEGFGYYDDLKEIKIKRPFGEISIETANNGGVHLYVRVTGNREKSWNIELNPEQSKKLIQDVAYFSTENTISKLKDKLEEETAPPADLAKADYIVYDTNNTESIFNDDSNKSVQAEYDQDEGTVYVHFKGARDKMYIQGSGKNYYIGYGSENGIICKAADFKKIMELLISFYYESDTTDKMISRTLRSIAKNGGTITPSDIESQIEYTKRLQAKHRSTAEVTESSMRGWVDVIQNAELEHDIDDADEQTLINTDRIDEMPLKYDSFMGMDPQIYVDKEAQINKPKNMKPIKNHGQWTTYRGKKGFMAYDNDTGEAIATVEGHENDGWFNVEVTASSRSVKGVVYQMFMDIINEVGIPILSGRLQSNDAMNFWKRLIQSHKVFVVANGEVIQQATPEKFHKYWSDEEGSPQSQFQFLLVK